MCKYADLSIVKVDTKDKYKVIMEAAKNPHVIKLARSSSDSDRIAELIKTIKKDA
ncbi:hypothetical protein [Mammaliicoccus vitulinus]|uniref:hypothetical protein n=1 Tax=Mammaliicoccus vitulinus TaxID=71237 RepID=UPI00248B97C4|nr:hypothetical protein [Mammaliicoccus vitulinus]